MRATNGSQYGGTSNFAPSMIPGGGVPCVNHPDEFVSYFCFSCHTHPICAECIIHGEHQGHDVQTIRKAMPEIQEHFESLVHSVAQKIEDLSIQENKLESKKRDVHEQNQELKHQVSSHFEDLRQKLDAKEREFINQLDLQALKSQSNLEQYIRLVKGRCANLSETEINIQNQRA